MPEAPRLDPNLPYIREALPPFLAQEDPYQRLAHCSAWTMWGERME